MSENVQVAVRMRPFNDRERAMDSTCCIRMVKETQQTIITDPETNVDKAFTFDYSYNSFAPPDDAAHASQDTVWDDIGVKVLEHAWNGFNVSLFAYGQTGSGKSFSMVGYGADKGIIPRASEVIFQRIDAAAPGVVFKVEASMMEIYNEHVKDLFNPSLDNLKIRDHPRHGPYPEGLTRHAVSSYHEISTLMDSGILARTTASTNMNATSSRAHTIFQIVVTQSELNPATNKVMDKVSRINLIDLAGSERAASTGATGARLKEGAAINQSLSALGNCISALADIANGKKKILVPYRNSKLTHLLKDSLGGNSKTIMIAALSPASVNYSETMSTLRYADRAKQIKNQAVVNEDPNQMLIRQLKEELEALRRSMMENGIDPSRPQSRGCSVDGMDGGGGSSFAARPERDPEKEKEIATIREQLEEHQRLLQESEKSWHERLKETEELARKREEQLKSLGLATNGSDLKAKAMTEPHLLNLNEDQLMAEKLLYLIQLGPNKVGRADAVAEQNIVIGGLGVLQEHCVITRTIERCSDRTPSGNDDENSGENSGVATTAPTEHERDVLTIRGVDAAKICVNGVALQPGKEVVLVHCDRLIVGNSNVFRVVIPSARPREATADDLARESQIDWQVAVAELNAQQLHANLEIEAQAEREKQAMDARVKQMEALMQSEQALADEKLRKQKDEWDRHVQLLTEAMKHKEREIQHQLQSEGEQDKKRLAEQLAEQEAKLAEELVKAEMSFERKQDELVRKQRELEASLQTQMREAKLLGQQKEREREERARFDDQLLHAIPLIDEANTIAYELQNRTTFAIKLVTVGPPPLALAHRSACLEDDEIAIGGGISAELRIYVTFQEAGTYRSVLWDVDQFFTSIYTMREIYQVFIEHNRVVDATLWRHLEPDPFHEPPQPQLIGRAFVFLANLVHGLRVLDATPIVDQSGVARGTMKCDVLPSVLSLEWQAQQHCLVETCPDDLKLLELPTLESFIGSNLRITFVVESLRGIPGKLCKDAFVTIKWRGGNDSGSGSGSEDEREFTSPPATAASVDPRIDFAAVIESGITAELIARLQSEPVEVQVYGIVPSSNLNKVASRALNVAALDFEQEQEQNDDGDDASRSIAFIDVDGARRDALSKKKSMRRQKGKGDHQDAATLLQQYREQLAMQEKTLAENTQELESKIHEVTQLQTQLTTTDHERVRLRDALEEMARTNKLLQAKLEQQILKQNVTKLLDERRKTVVAKVPGADATVATSSAKSGSKTTAELNALVRAAFFEEDEANAGPKPATTGTTATPTTAAKPVVVDGATRGEASSVVAPSANSMNTSPPKSSTTIQTPTPNTSDAKPVPSKPTAAAVAVTQTSPATTKSKTTKAACEVM